jgi:hypothetical protein
LLLHFFSNFWHLSVFASHTSRPNPTPVDRLPYPSLWNL